MNFNFESFVLGFACAVLFMKLVLAYGSRPIWYQRWRDRRSDRRFWAHMNEDSRAWYRANLPKHELEKYEP